VSADRRVREDRRFVAGKGRFVADIDLPNTKHVALLTCPHAAARIISIDKRAALAMPGVRYVLDGSELAAATLPLMAGSTRQTCRAARWQSTSLAIPANGLLPWWQTRGPWPKTLSKKSMSNTSPCPSCSTPNKRSNRCRPGTCGARFQRPARQDFRLGSGRERFCCESASSRVRVKWARSSTVPIETFGVVANWDPWRDLLDVYASIQMPKYPDQIGMALRLPASSVRVHYDVDVGGSYGVKRGIKHSVLVAYLARRLGFPVRLLEDRLENMRGGDAHGPERLFDVDVAFDDNGLIRSMKMCALENIGAYAGRSPSNSESDRRHRGTVQNQERSVSCDRHTDQQNSAGCGARLRPGAHQSGNRKNDRRGRKYARPRSAGGAATQHDQHEEFPYTISERNHYDSGDYHRVVDKVVDHTIYNEMRSERDRLRAEGKLAGIGVAACLEPSGGNASFEPLLNPKNATTTWMDSCRIDVDLTAAITATMHTSSAGQGHETLVATVIAEVLGRDRTTFVLCARIHSIHCQATVRSAAQAIMLGGAAFHAAHKLKAKLTAIGAHDLGIPAERAIYEQGNVCDRTAPDKRRTWEELVAIAHRNFHRLPEGFEPGLAVAHVYQVRPAARYRRRRAVQMYPCFSFEFHLLLLSIDPDLGTPKILRYRLGHDCGTVINPKIVRGMTMGGIAHGIGAALYEEFAYNEDGQLIARLSWIICCRPRMRCRRSRSSITRHRHRIPCLVRRALASPAISGRRSHRECGQRRDQAARYFHQHVPLNASNSAI
jgi:CO/xanthine dehydrogenase Mo-binding subunit